MEKKEQRSVMKFLWLKGWGAKRIYEELLSTLGDHSYAVAQIKIWLQKFRNGHPAKIIRAPEAFLNFGAAT
jgi:hypothetical protein